MASMVLVPGPEQRASSKGQRRGGVLNLQLWARLVTHQRHWADHRPTGQEVEGADLMARLLPPASGGQD